VIRLTFRTASSKYFSGLALLQDAKESPSAMAIKAEQNRRPIASPIGTGRDRWEQGKREEEGEGEK
jgi:hypothetical protein